MSALAPHETLELRELLSTTVLGAKKIQVSMPMIQDEELKAYMERCLNTKKDSINSIQTFVESTQS
jgi:hypothetical protein